MYIAKWPARRQSETLLVLSLFAILVCLRMPEIIIKGRFWAEEGRYFFHDAWTLSPMQALLMTVGGYLNIVANAATLGARWLLPLQLAPYLTIMVALLIQLFPPLLLLTARDGWLEQRLIRVAAVFLLLVVPASEEVWLQTLHSQFELTLCCGIILGLGPAAPAVGRLRLVLIGLAPLCGPGAIALAPLYLARAIVDRTRSRFVQFIVLSVSSSIQLVFFFKPVIGRSYSLSPTILLSIITVHHLAVPFLGVGVGQAVADHLRVLIEAGQRPLEVVLVPLLLVCLLASAGVSQNGRSNAPMVWLLSGAVVTAIVSYFGAIGGELPLIAARIGERYAYVPQALLALVFAALAGTASGALQIAARAICLWLLVIGSIGYFSTWAFVADGPAWRPEVAAWRLDPHHLLKTWPDGWDLALSPHDTR